MKAFLFSGLFGLTLACAGWVLRGQPRAETGSAQPEAHGVRLTDATASAGVRFTHLHGGSERHHFVELMGGGGAFLDYNGDSWPDFFLTQGTPLPGTRPAGLLPPALYRNNRDGTFTDVTRETSLDHPFYGLGMAVGDYDNDGWPDLFVTGLGGNRLFHNRVGVRFEDVTSQAGLRGKDLCTGAAWVDYDHDGKLDLFVCRYTDYDLAADPECGDQEGKPAYCEPLRLADTTSRLYHNEGHGRFSDGTRKSGIGSVRGHALGALTADLNEDGWPDLYVACDDTPNRLFLNRRDGTFREAGDAAAVSTGQDGRYRGGMGVDAGDYDNDGRLDLVVTNFEAEPISLFRNLGHLNFRDESYRSGLGAASLPYLKWGCRFVDLDRDGFQDLFVANGHVHENPEELGQQGSHAQPCRIYRNDRDGCFSDISAVCGTFFSHRQVARAAAFGDYDNDGDLDVLIACNNQPAILLRNDTRTPNHWIRLCLNGAGCNRDALGARVRVRAGGLTQTQEVRSGGSYLADHDRRLLFGLGSARRASVEIHWPCGAMQTLEVEQGSSTVVPERGCRIDSFRPAGLAAALGSR